MDTCGVAVAENWISSHFDTVCNIWPGSLSFDKKKGSVTLWPEVDVNIYIKKI